MKIGAIGGMDRRQLVEAYATMPVGDGPREVGGHVGHGGARVDDDEVVAKAVHLHERQAGRGVVLHGGANSKARELYPEKA
ncbi:hypothetical protein [Limimaricola hongkongensis]|uniref:hypothetical protein n=1 Tax=Limimaricola hongkongensis TaxID=278132 RepID=UPI001FDF3701|nr:hypothetical protein [Limimaricola hongkongensis]